MAEINIAERIKKIAVDHLDCDPAKVTSESRFVEDLGADSLDQVELIMALEEEFDVEIPDDHAENIKTVGDAITLIEQKTKETA